MAKVDQWDKNAWVLAVDMKKKRLKDVAEFGAERNLGIGFAYMSSKISEYPPTPPGRKGHDNHEESLRPPTHGAAATAAASAWVLLDYHTFIANHRNATTAKSKTRSGQPIEVSL
ncbi:hypothetical protein E2562_011177 [Oryza meyeriana var. granulata]|uniref:Uncharacterized protein n=1 Tax=Oryza meyeriana var. granulata TaxID=110450 RepID=A0A6G1DGK4_9ORYZ|nr:hypothetical protein E2562_011177 [Oryza meyeriana var. granulata]